MNAILSGMQFGKWTVIERVKRSDMSKGAKYLCQCACGTIKVVWGKYLRSGKSLSCGCTHKVSWEGRRFGKLTVISIESNSGVNTYRCKCDCGNSMDVVGSSIYETSSCGCSRRKNLVGNKYGKLIVKEMIYESKKPTLCRCECDCGNIVIVRANGLVTGNATSCGCLHSPSLLGQRFGKLTVTGESEPVNNQRVWKCECECGSITYVKSHLLNSGHTSSCGCLRSETHSKGETFIKNILDSLGIKYIQEKTFEDLVGHKGWALRFDFYIPSIRLAIEYDGEQHSRPIEYFGGKERFNILKANDNIKNTYCENNNIRLIRLPYSLSAEEVENILLNNLEMFENPVTTTVA